MKHDSKNSATDAKPTHEQISIRAELLWKAQGSPTDKDEQIWLEAERQLFDEAREIIAATESISNQQPAESRSKTPSVEAERMTQKRSNSPAAKRKASGK